MINLQKLIEQEFSHGYIGANASAKVCQDIVLKALSEGPLSRNVTIKGGVVMRSKTQNVRRATQDLDIDFLKYSLENESIDAFIDKLNCIEGLKIFRLGEIEKLKQQDYKGKRVHIMISDSLGHKIKSKIDLGVHIRFEIEQEEYCFDVALDDEGASLLINTDEQMFAEKLRALLKFGPFSTRFKDIFDLYYLCSEVDHEKLKKCLKLYIYDDPKMKENGVSDIVKRLRMTFHDPLYKKAIMSSDKNWTDETTEKVMSEILAYIENMKSF